jgi:hypothetical protein
MRRKKRGGKGTKETRLRQWGWFYRQQQNKQQTKKEQAGGE